MDGKIFVLFLFPFFIKPHAAINEPKCFSSFDFQEKLLEKMVILTHEVDTLEHLFHEKIKELTNIMETKMTTFERQQTNKLEQTNQKVGDFLTETNLKLQRFSLDMSAMNTSFRGNLKPNVAFLAKAVSDTLPGTNKQLVFTQTLVNTDDVYSTTTGYFTAPVEGTYLFSSQICGNSGKFVNFRIFVNDKMYSDTTQYDADSSYSCTISTTVAILKVGDRVCVKTGLNTSSGTVIFQGAYRWSMFQGALVN